MEIYNHTEVLKEDMLKTGVYMITHILTPYKCYIGSAACTNSKETGFLRRWKRHLSELKNNKHYNIKLQRIVNKYGLKGLRFYVLEYCNPVDCINKEDYYIQYLDSFNNGLNLTLKAKSCLGRKVTEEAKIRMSKAQKGRVLSQETKDNISKAKKGFKYTEEQIQNIKNNCTTKKTIYLYNFDGSIFKIFDSSAECDRYFNIKKGRTSFYISQKGILKRKYIVSHNLLQKEYIDNVLQSRKIMIDKKIQNMNSIRKSKHENTEVISKITKGLETP